MLETLDERDLARRRGRMVETQIERRGIKDERLLAALRRVPRDAFVPEQLREFAYDDTALPIGGGQTISQPYVVALMIEAAEVGPEDRVLEIGTGSGYAAAVLGLLAREVWTIERRQPLAETAERRLARLGHANVHFRRGDGTEGWPEAAPFDAILVTAGGPEIPRPLLAQLAPGGRLVIPVGARREGQRLVRVVRPEDGEPREEDLGLVAFVPLVGAHGWPEQESGSDEARGRRPGGAGEPRPAPAAPRSAVELVRDAAEPLPDLADPAFPAFIDRFADARVVLLGEATHGTSEFYRARARITRRLIERHGFRIVAVEADWPDAEAIDRYVRHRPAAAPDRPVFARFPSWMWRNTDVQDFVSWLREHNAGIQDPRARTGFYGLDLYALNASIEAVVDYLERTDPAAAQVARERYGCLTPWQRDPATYGRAALSAGYGACEQEVLAALRELLDKRLDHVGHEGDEFLDAVQNARLVAAAEQYYRTIYYAGEESWNLRDTHMFDTLEQVLRARGPDARAVVWAHNSHVGDAAATEMGIARGQLNIGQLARERWGGAAVLIGFGTDRGTVAAATDWGGVMEIKTVRPARRDSYERLCHEAGKEPFLLDLRPGHVADELRRELAPPRLERAIGVIYRPESERWSHYFEASLPRQFDAWLWFDETRAVTPLPTAAERSEGAPDTYPFGL